MNTTAAQSSSRDRVAADPALAELVDRLTARLQDGEPIDLAAVAAQHPEYADRLRQLLPALEVLADLGRSAAHEAAPSGSGPLAEVGVLGDYRIVREVGRGGMGVVYEARQISLNRRVALKVLPFAAALDPRQLHRFHNEAQAAAGLHHTQIVPVFAVGVERGVHYYAMQFIEGRPLSEVIRALRPLDLRKPPERATPDKAASEPPTAILSSGSSPTGRPFFQAVARLGIQVAEALEYAHSLGVLHRDIKPANLLLDTRGEVWVTDFGLARIQAEAGLTLTLTGDVLGTLRYMSPEQALGPRGLADHRSDIYSLGVTLYELLTLQPAVGGSDRQEILRRIAFEEPAPPRWTNPEIPRELETVLLKAIAKEPESRYATAQDLADDLERFLEHKPIRAKRPTIRDRGVKWARRHPSVLASTVVALVLLLAGLGVSTILIERQRDEARRQARRADLRSGQARRAVDAMYTRFAQKWLANQPGLQPAQREFLIEALRFYQEFASEEGRDAETRRLVGQSFLRVSAIQRSLEDMSAAQEAARSAREIFASLALGRAASPEDRSLLAEAEVVSARLANLLGHAEDEKDAYHRAIDIRRSLARERPHDLENQLALASALYGIHDIPSTQESVTILGELLTRDPRRADYRWELSNALAYLGSLFYDRGDLASSERHHIDALRLREELVAEFPDDYQYRRRLLISLIDRGRDLYALGRLPEAETIFHQALAMSRRLAKDFPAFPVGLANVSINLSNLGLVIRDQGRFAEAEPYLVEAVTVAQRVVDQHPDIPRYQDLTALRRVELGRLLEKTGRYPDALRVYRDAMRVLEEIAPRTINAVKNESERAEAGAWLAHLLATCPDPGLRDPTAAVTLARDAAKLNPKVAEIWHTLGVTFYRTGEWDAAIEALEKSMELQPRADASNWCFLAMAFWQKGDKEQSRRWYGKAAAWMEKNPAKNDDFVQLRDEAAALLGVTGHPKPAETRKENPPQRSKP